MKLFGMTIAKSKDKPKLLKAFGVILKAFGTQLGMFNDEVIEGQTKQKDGHSYVVKRSNKNPLVKRLFRADKEESKPKELSLFDKKVTVGSRQSAVGNRAESKPPKAEPIRHTEQPEAKDDLFNQPKEERKEPKAEIKVVKGKKNRKEINAKVEELLKTKKNDEMSAEDVELLAQYTGRGGLLGDTLEDISLNEFYTRKDEAEFIWDMIGKLGFKGGNVLEPSMGTGIFVETAPEKALVTGIEIEETSGRIGQILHGNEHDIRIQSFEQFVKDYDNMGADLEGGEYDAIVGNCPFGKRGLSAMDDREKSDIKFHEQYFIDRGLDMLKPGGIMAMIVPTSIMDNQLNQWRGEVNKKGEFLGAIRVPTGAFKHTDAQVTTDIVFFKKRPPEVIDHLNKLSKEELGEAYDDMVMDADFVSGNFFKNNPEYALGTETSGMFGMKIWKGDITKADLEKVGELLNHEARDYSSLGIDVSKYGELEKELEPGDVKILNGRTYILNKNHRWERLKDQEVVLQNLPEDIKKLGITSWDEWRIKSEDTAYLYGLDKDQLKLFGQTRIVNELDGYNGKNDFQTEYLTKGVVLGLAVKDFRKELQDGRLSAEEAQMEAGKLKILLKDFIEKYGHPIENLKLNKFFKNSGNAPLLNLAGSYDKNGNTIKMFDDPLSFYKVYQTKSEIGTVDRNNIVSVIGFLFANNFPTDYQTVRGEYEGDGDIERELAYSDEIYFDEEGNYKPKEEVLYGYIYEKIDAWEKQRTELKKESKNEKLSDKEKELNAQKMRKLEDQIIEAKTRANIREIKQLPIMLSDAGSIYDIGILNKYLEEKIGAHFLGELRKDEKSGFILPVDESSAKLYLSYADITKEGKSTDVKRELRDLFNKDEHPLLFMILNKMNGLGLPALRTEEGIAKKEQVLQLETDFKQYLSDSEEADKIADTYNRLFNSYIQKTYDEKPIEGIKHFAYDRVVGKDASGKDITGKDKAGGHTWATVRRMYEQGKGMIAHGVGLGKTLEALTLTLLSKETGRANKPCIVSPKSVLLNWVAEIEKWTHGVNYLLVGYSKKNESEGWTEENTIEDSREVKELKLQRAANEDFDMILMSRDLFGTIDFSPETKKNMLNELMDKYYPEGNRLSTFSDGDSKYAKNVKKKRDTLLRNLSEMMDIPEPLGGVYLDNIGIDMLVRDEAHDTKNLLVPMESEISGVNSSTSQRAMHNLFASKIIRGQNNDMGYFGLTATPISNSPLEVFNMMVPFAEKELEKLQVQNMDDFVSRFADIDNIPTTSADGRVIVKNKFSGWKSAEALRNTFFRFVDYKTKDDVESVKANIKFPKEKAANVLSDLNEGQKEIVKHCKLRLWMLSSRVFDKDNKTWDFNADKLQEKVGEGLISQDEATEVLNYFNDEYLPKYEALNARLGPDDTPNDDHFFKVQQDLIKATSDLPWYKDKHSEYSKEVDDDLVKQHSDLKKFAQLNESALSIHKSGGKQIIFAINTALHEKIKNDLVKSGIPENEIVIVNGKTVSSSSKRLQISKAYNDGKYKVVIGNYATMGEGLNFNYMTSDIHHLQPAWNHLQIEQGNGRGIRQGNPLDSVNTHYYLTKGSIDGFMNTKIMDKAGMVDKFLKGETSRWDDEVQLEADEMMIELADNPEQAKALLAFRNKKLQDALAEQQRQSNYKQLDRLYEVKRKKSGMAEKTSKQYQMMEQEERSLTEKLIEANFEHKGKLDYDRTPVILPGINKVIPVGGILEGKSGEFYVVEDYAPSTQRVKIRTYKAGTQGDMVGTRAISAKELDKEFNALHKETDLDLGGMFKKIIDDNEEVGINFISKIPKEILQINKVKLLEKLNNTDEVLYQTMDGDFKVADYESAKDEIATEGGKIIFPQEKPEFPKILNELIKLHKPKQNWGEGYYQFRKYKNFATSIYGENYENAIKKEIKRLNGEATETSFAIHTTGAKYKKTLKDLADNGYMNDYTYKRIMQGKAYDELSEFSNALRAEFFDNYNIRQQDKHGDYWLESGKITPEMLDRARAIDEIKSDDNKDLLEDILTNKLRGEAA
ncbi:MAG: SNF2-related protein [Ignavibacteriaceae bacterium]|nr:SNF2-related protein [Ignavibacteriaceae bacterium]